MVLTLQECSPGFGCVITTFCSTLGCAPADAGKTLKQVVKDDRNEDLEDIRPDYARPDWLKDFEKMGVKVTKTNLAPLPYRATIDEGVPALPPGPLYVVYCEPPGGKGDTHVFATQNGKVVDTYTDGKIIDFIEVPPDFPPYEVEAIYVIEEATPSS
ncbi:MAG TPA: hypothetical protein VIM11_18890 [Tepidisphaeraceae bacterium]|jgi:hypothetical protein